jgi:hypothetical protein
MKNLRVVLGTFVIAIVWLGLGTAMAAQGKLHTMVGEVKKINQATHSVTLIESAGKKEKEMVLQLAPQASISRTGEKVTLGDLKEKDRIRVQYVNVKGKLTAHSISLQNRMAEPAKLNTP